MPLVSGLSPAVHCRPETPSDVAAIHEVVRQAFGQDEEALLVDALRAGGHAPVSWVAEIEGSIVGHVMFSHLGIDPSGADANGRATAALALAPLSVAPAFQRQGVGTALTRAALDECRRQGHRIVVVLGHPEYYPRFGFRPEPAEAFEAPFSGPSLMALELVPGALAGVRGKLRYAEPFGIASSQ